MSKQANPALIGSFIVGAVIILIVGIIIFSAGKWFNETKRFVVFFDESINGLIVGAPVKLYGVQIGQVVEIKVERDIRLKKMLVPVVFEIEPDKVINYNAIVNDKEPEEVLEELIKDGLRLQLQMTSMLTGRLFIEARFLPETPVKLIHSYHDLPEVPSVPSSVQEIQNTINKLLNDFNNIPLEELFKEILETVRSINNLAGSEETRNALTALKSTIFDLQQIVANVNSHSGNITRDIQQIMDRGNRIIGVLDKQTGPLLSSSRQTVESANSAFLQMQSTMKTIENTGNDVAPVSRNLESTLKELAKASRSFRILMDYLERHPEALISGKANTTGE